MYCDCRYLWEGGQPGPNNILDNFAENVCAVISRGIQSRMQPGGGDGSPGKNSKRNRSLKPDKQHNTQSTVRAMRVGNNLGNMG
jgi:hypothetical protein